MPDDNNRPSSQDRWWRDLMIVALVTVAGMIVAMLADAVTPLHVLLMQHPNWHGGEAVLGLGLLMAALIWFSWRRQRDSRCHMLESSAMADRYRQARDELSFLISATPGVLYTSRPESDLGAIFISPSIKAQTGYDPGDFTGDPKYWVDHIHPDDKERVLTGLSALFEHGHHTHEYRFRHADGAYRWMHDQLTLLRDQGGKPEKIAGLWIDITDRKNIEQRLNERVAERTANLKRANQSLLQEMEERKQTETALNHSKEQYKRLIDNLPGHAYRCDNDKSYTARFISQSIEKLLGIKPGDFIDNRVVTFGDLIHPDYRKWVWNSEQQCLAEHRLCELEYRIITPSGVVKWLWDRPQGVDDARREPHRS